MLMVKLYVFLLVIGVLLPMFLYSVVETWSYIIKEIKIKLKGDNENENK